MMRALVVLILVVTAFGHVTSVQCAPNNEMATTMTIVATTSTLIAGDALTSAGIQASIDELARLDGATAQQITEATKALRAAQANLETAAQQKQRAEGFASQRKSVADLLRDSQEETSRILQLQVSEVDATATAAQIEAMRTNVQSMLASARTTARDLEREPQRRAQRVAEIPAARTKTDTAASEIEKLRRDQAAATQLPALREALEMESRTARMAAEATAAALDAELEWLTASSPVLTAELDLSAARVRAGEARMAALQVALDAARKAEAEREAAAARKAAEDAARLHPEVLAVAQENERLAALRTGPESFTSRLAKTERMIADLTSTTQALMDAREAIARRESLGTRADRAMAALLARYSSMIPEVAKSNASIRQREEEIASEQVRLLELEEERVGLRNLDAAVERLAAQLTPETTGTARTETLNQARTLYTAQRTLLTELTNDAGRLFNRLIELQDVETRQVSEATKLSKYIEERTLWLRTQRTMAFGDILKLAQLFAVAFDPAAWMQALRQLAVNAPTETILVMAMFLILLAAGRLGRRRVTNMTSNAAPEQSMRHIVIVGMLTVAVAACGPLVAFLFGNLLTSSAHSVAVVQAGGEVLIGAAIVWFMYEVIAESSRRTGLMVNVMGSDPRLAQELHRTCRWVVLWILPMGILTGTLNTPAVDPQQSGAVRVISMLNVLLLAWITWKLLHPTRGLLARLWSAGGQLPYENLRGFAFVLTLLALAGCLGLIFVGYHPLARAVLWRVALTLWLWLALTLCYGFAEALLRAARRRVAKVLFEHVRRDQTESVTTAEGGPPRETGATAIQMLERLREQTQRVLKFATILVAVVALWVMWSGVLPALDVITRQPLWTYMTQVPDPSASAGAAAMVDRVVPVRVADLLQALLIAAIALVGGRNVPGLLDTMLLQRLQLDRGGRYALSTITGYVIALVGTVAAFSVIGIGWSDVQWLAAAVTVGLGFGLQEIFANFVSGIIILAERPVRVGDIVTVKGVDGIVTRIQMRATTITDWQRRDFIVPNKQIITGEVTNWTRTDRVTRLEFNISVAPTANADEVRELLLGIAAEQPDVMRNPAPHALLDTFGPWKQNFVMRCFLANNENGLAVRHAIMTRISEELKARNLNPL